MPNNSKIQLGGEFIDLVPTPGGDYALAVSSSRPDEPYNDAFQRLRVSNTDQRFDAEFIYDKQPLLFDEIVSGGGTVIYNSASRDLTIATGGTALTDAAGMYQHFANPYTAGNSQLIILTGVLNGGTVNGTAQAFLRSASTGGTVTEAVNISPSGIDWSKSQIFVMDFQSLKVGRIRYALDRNGLLEAVAEITNDNERVTGYWQHANHPVYFKAYNTAENSITEFGYGDDANAIGFRFVSALSAAQTARAICCTVKSEGGGSLLELAGYPFAASNGATTKAVSTSLIPLLSIQLKTTFGAGKNDGIVIPTTLSFVTDNPMHYQVIINGSLTNANFSSVNANSICNADVSATAISGGRVIDAGYVGSGGTRSGGSDRQLAGKIPLSVNYAGTTGDIMTIAAVRVGTTNAAAGAALDWVEIR